jgi:hypothetical protein
VRYGFKDKNTILCAKYGSGSQISRIDFHTRLAPAYITSWEFVFWLKKVCGQGFEAQHKSMPKS